MDYHLWPHFHFLQVCCCRFTRVEAYIEGLSFIVLFSLFSEQVTATNIYVNNSLQIGDRVHLFTSVYNYYLHNESKFFINAYLKYIKKSATVYELFVLMREGKPKN